jgi:hypothetical protein
VCYVFHAGPKRYGLKEVRVASRVAVKLFEYILSVCILHLRPLIDRLQDHLELFGQMSQKSGLAGADIAFNRDNGGFSVKRRHADYYIIGFIFEPEW